MNSKMRDWMMAGASVLLLTSGAQLWAQDTPGPSDRKFTYSPYPTQSYPDRVYFGDTHLHTSYSTDAGMVGCDVGPEEAYRFARGEEVKSNSGLRVSLQRPLDFLVITDHAENLGLAPMIAESNPAPQERVGQARSRPGQVRQGARGLQRVGRGDAGGEGPVQGPGEDMADRRGSASPRPPRSTTSPGRFTAFIGFEWTSTPERQQPAPQRDLPRRHGQGRPGHAALALRHRGPRGPVEVDGDVRGEDRRPGAGHPAQRQPVATA